MDETEINKLIDSTVKALHEENSEESMRSVGYLVAMNPINVTEELSERIIFARELRKGKEISESIYMTDPKKAYALMDALESQDVAAVHAAVGDKYSEFIVSMITTLAALTDDK